MMCTYCIYHCWLVYHILCKYYTHYCNVVYGCIFISLGGQIKALLFCSAALLHFVLLTIFLHIHIYLLGTCTQLRCWNSSRYSRMSGLHTEQYKQNSYIYTRSTAFALLKGQSHEILCTRFFSSISLFWSYQRCPWEVLIFFCFFIELLHF